MNENEVRIVRLEPKRAVRFHGFGSNPENLAWEKMEAWAEPRGFLDLSKEHRIFGFNNPNPSPGSPNYGYEFWLTLDPDDEPGGDVEVDDLPGGGQLYAVTRCEVRGDAYEVIPATWQKLITWREESRYREAGHQWLEEHIEAEVPGAEFVLDLFLPIIE